MRLECNYNPLSILSRLITRRRTETLCFFRIVKDRNSDFGQRPNGNAHAAHFRLIFEQDGGGERDRTDDLLLAKQALSQLSYTPVNREKTSRTLPVNLVGLDGVEPSTSRLSGVRSNQTELQALANVETDQKRAEVSAFLVSISF